MIIKKDGLTLDQIKSLLDFVFGDNNILRSKELGRNFGLGNLGQKRIVSFLGKNGIVITSDSSCAVVPECSVVLEVPDIMAMEGAQTPGQKVPLRFQEAVLAILNAE